MRVDLATAFSRGFLSCYDAVVFTDVDEFLVRTRACTTVWWTSSAGTPA